jgi:hypothetical protein
MLRLRGHHLICLHFFTGEGYDDTFMENLKNVLKRAETEDIETCDDADEICEKCPYLKDNKCSFDEHADEQIKEMDKTALNLLEVTKNSIVWDKIKGNMPEIFPQWFRKYCIECDWRKACEKNHYYQRLRNRSI